MLAKGSDSLENKVNMTGEVKESIVRALEEMGVPRGYTKGNPEPLVTMADIEENERRLAAIALANRESGEQPKSDQ